MPGFSTNAIHAAQPPDPVTGAVIPPLSFSTTFIQEEPGKEGPFAYSRCANPTRNAFEGCMAALEGGKHGIAFASGLAATTTFLHLFNSGDHVLCMDDVYGGTNRLMQRVGIPKYGLKLDFVDFTNKQALDAAFTPDTKLVWLESPTNPTLKIADIQMVCEVAHKHNCLVVVDNTFASSYCQKPLQFGADVVMHSVTKFLNGHSDVVMGVLVTSSDEIADKVRFYQNACGGVPGPMCCYLALRGLKTLAVRMQASEKNAFALAEMLVASDKVERVVFPGLPSHPQHEIAKKQMTCFGGMITFFLKGGLEESNKFLRSLKLITLAESLGGVESLIEHPGLMTHTSVPVEQRAQLGISDSLIRLSVGIEDLEDLKADIQGALDQV
jgi:cystathionine gamma-lyase